ncbi:MAG: RNA methyltransferase [Bacteroidetes bacterium]|nr:RNA methyltransferase [Bacteroidota bacterium]
MLNTALPVELLQSLKGVPGFNEEAFTGVHASGQQVVSVRVNPAKMKESAGELFPGIDVKIPWSSDGWYLKERPLFTTDPCFHAGAYYVQEASSMFLEQALRQTANLSQPLQVLDLCAAPGGKSTLLQSLISNESVLVSNEVIKTRVTILSENIAKWGAANVIVTNNDPKDFQRLPSFFDVMVVDAPCSGSGLFRRDADAVQEWSLNNVQLCSQRQQRILADALPALKENGILIYSTCSYSAAEDEEICDWLCGHFEMEPVRLQLQEEWNITATVSKKAAAHGYRFYPDQVRGEGFFIAAFRKKTGSNSTPAKKIKSAINKATKNEIQAVQTWLQSPERFSFIQQDDHVLAIPVFMMPVLETVQQSLYVKKSGIRLGAVIRNEMIPHHELAMSTLMHEAIPHIDTSLETALQYLRRNDIQLTEATKGWSLLQYRQLPLGWIKVLPNRINNYYPKEWRILHK